MLQEIRIANEASYSAAGQVLTGLKPINFIFGTNGSGKTTISRVIADPSTRPSCSLSWSGGTALECLVYNSDFATRNFVAQMPGIFTLGEANTEILSKITITTDHVNSLNNEIQRLENTLGPVDNSAGKRGDLRSLRSKLEEQCWKIKTTHDQHFQEAFTGVRSSKANFCDKLLSEWAQNSAGIVPLEDLKKRADIVFAKGLERINPIDAFDATALIALEQEPILAKRVVGKDDIDIAALIRRLGNSDWVKQGLTYVNAAGSQCPFCQQDITADLTAKLNEYFDETYLADIAAINRTRAAYANDSVLLIDRLEEIHSANNKYLDSTAFRASIDHFSAKVRLNLQQLDRKRTEASVQISLESLSEIAASLRSTIDAANAKIATHNATVDNLVTERKTLISEIWKCLVEEAKFTLTDYDTTKSALDQAVQSLAAGIASKRAALIQAKAELVELERSVTSVQPTVTNINSILKSFGFTGFHLATAKERPNLYEIIREDGSQAAATLSEGERSFITFLYFYHLIQGSTTTSGINAPRVVVFDDPISSLDSDVLFIVSALIKRVLKEACSGNNLIRQVFVLTHNTYFHKEVSFLNEVSFDPKRSKDRQVQKTFWIVRKVDDQSIVTRYDDNPISTSHELLWKEVRSPNRSKITIQNTLRRILEHYFRILGNLNFGDICTEFEGYDQQICKSLFSWIHDGSHHFDDDLHISTNEGMIDRYLDVFRRIFEVTDHEAHYKMMMGPEALAVTVAEAAE